MTEIFVHDGADYLSNRKCISNAIQLSAITFAYTPTLRSTNIEFSDVATSGATGFIIKSGSLTFMAFNVSDGIHVYKPFLMSINALSGISSVSASGFFFHQRAAIYKPQMELYRPRIENFKHLHGLA